MTEEDNERIAREALLRKIDFAEVWRDCKERYEKTHGQVPSFTPLGSWQGGNGDAFDVRNFDFDFASVYLKSLGWEAYYVEGNGSCFLYSNMERCDYVNTSRRESLDKEWRTAICDRIQTIMRGPDCKKKDIVYSGIWTSVNDAISVGDLDVRRILEYEERDQVMDSYESMMRSCRKPYLGEIETVILMEYFAELKGITPLHAIGFWDNRSESIMVNVTSDIWGGDGNGKVTLNLHEFSNQYPNIAYFPLHDGRSHYYRAQRTDVLSDEGKRKATMEKKSLSDQLSDEVMSMCAKLRQDVTDGQAIKVQHLWDVPPNSNVSKGKKLKSKFHVFFSALFVSEGRCS